MDKKEKNKILDFSEEVKKYMESKSAKIEKNSEKLPTGKEKITPSQEGKTEKKVPGKEEQKALDKIDLLLTKFDQQAERIDRLEEVYKKSIVTSAGNPADKTKTKNNEQSVEELEREQEKTQGKKKGQEYLPQEVYAKLSDKEKVKAWEEGARKQRQIQQSQAGNPANPQSGNWWSQWGSDLIGKVVDKLGGAVIEEIKKASTAKTDDGKKGASIGGGADFLGEQLGEFAKAWATIFGSAQTVVSTVQQNAFRDVIGYLKMMSPDRRQQAIENFTQSGPEPGVPVIVPTIPENVKSIRIIEE